MDSHFDANLSAGEPSPASQATPWEAAAVARVRRNGSDPYDTIVARLQRNPANKGDGFAVGVLGCGRQAGATTVTANTGIRFADHGLGPVLLVDGDFQAGGLSRAFRMTYQAGLSDAVTAGAGLEGCIHSTDVDGLSLMPGGTRGLAGLHDLQDKVGSLLAELRNDFAVVLVDLPSAEDVAPVLPLAQSVDAALVIVRSESASNRLARAAVRHLTQRSVPVVGSVLTRRKAKTAHWVGRGA